MSEKNIGDIKGGKRDLAVMQKVDILRHEGKGNVGVCCLLAKLAFR